MVLRSRDRSFIKLGQLRLMSSSTHKEVDPSFKQTLVDYQPVSSPSSPKNAVANGIATSQQDESILTRHCEVGAADSIQSPMKQKLTLDTLVDMVNGVQEEATLIRSSIEVLKTGFEEELDLLAESVSAFTGRISEVDALKLEVKSLKRRLERLEQGKSSIQSPHPVNGMAERSARLSRLAKYARFVAKEAKSINLPATAADSRPSGSKKWIEGSGDANASTNGVNQQVNGDIGSSASSSDTESHVQPIPATRPSVARYMSSPSPSEMSDAALEFEPKAGTGHATQKSRSAVSLKSHRLLPSSDREAEEYKPQVRRSTKSSLRRGRPIPSRGVRRVGRPRNSRSRITKPEWERPEGNQSTNWTHGRAIVRRGVSGRVVNSRSETKRSSSAPRLEVESTVGDQRVDNIGRPLNEDGIPLRPDGKPDRRFLPKTIRDKSGVLRYVGDDADGRSKTVPVTDTPEVKPDRTNLEAEITRLNGTLEVDTEETEETDEPDETNERRPNMEATILDKSSKKDPQNPNSIEKTALLKKVLEIAAPDATAPRNPTVILPDEPSPPIKLKRSHSESGSSVDGEPDIRSIKRFRDDDTEIRDEDIAELSWRWGIQQQSS